MDIYNLMTDNMDKVAEFNDACKTLMNSQYILAEKEIIRILKIVATSKVLQRVIGRALEGFDYSLEARTCNVRGTIAAPSEDKKVVAFVFCLLSDMDEKKIYLNDFLRKFFFNGDINRAHRDFGERLIEPFRCAVLNMIYPSDQSEEDIDLKAKVQDYAMALAERINGSSIFAQNIKEDYIFVCDQIASSFSEDNDTARGLVIGLRRAIGDMPEFNQYIAALEEVLI